MFYNMHLTNISADAFDAEYGELGFNGVFFSEK